MRALDELIETKEPAIILLRQWVEDADVPCELLEPNADREAVLAEVQVTTHSTLGALAYDTGGLLVDDGWLRILGSGHPRLERTLPGWNAGRAQGFYLVADDAAGGFFALNAGALGPEKGSVYYWAPDSLEWECLDLGLSDFVYCFLSSRIEAFYEELRWPSWRADVRNLSSDQCFSFFPFLWAREGSVESSLRGIVPVSEAFDLKMDLARQIQ